MRPVFLEPPSIDLVIAILVPSTHVSELKHWLMDLLQRLLDQLDSLLSLRHGSLITTGFELRIVEH